MPPTVAGSLDTERVWRGGEGRGEHKRQNSWWGMFKSFWYRVTRRDTETWLGGKGGRASGHMGKSYVVGTTYGSRIKHVNNRYRA